jgi:hypothetical protein
MTKKPKNVKLNPCPFCQSRAELIRTTFMDPVLIPAGKGECTLVPMTYDGEMEKTFYRVQCCWPSCMVHPKTKEFENPKAAVNYWNDRNSKCSIGALAKRR